MDATKNYPVPNLVKPIINLFANEKSSAKYRQYLSDPENFKKHEKCFRDLIYGAIDEFGKHNQTALEQKPPLDDPTKVL